MIKIILIIAVLVGGYFLLVNLGTENTVEKQEKKEEVLLDKQKQHIDDMQKLNQQMQENLNDRMQSNDP